MRDDRPFAGPAPPAAVFFYSRDRGGEHPERHLGSYAGLMQADAYAGFNRLYEANRKPYRHRAETEWRVRNQQLTGYSAPFGCGVLSLRASSAIANSAARMVRKGPKRVGDVCANLGGALTVLAASSRQNA